ncbi:hypothetical protein BgiMline_030802, partial [Biomphalaria glabrata]
SAQQSIVSQLQYSSGDTFNITCDASRFSGLKTEDYFLSMSMWRQVSPQAAFINIASYEPLAKLNTTKNVSSQWQVNFSGGEGYSNRNIMKIVVTVVNYQCTDAGLYKCQAVMPSPITTYETTPVNLTAKVGITQNNISMAPHNQADGTDENSSVNSVGEEISMTCTFTGPANLQAVWKRNDEDYPYPNNITNSNPSSSVVSGCNIYTYSSELKFTLEESDSGYTYICVVTEGNIERSRKMFTIEVKSTPDDNGNTGSNTAGAEINVGAIVGGVIGGVVFLVIVVVLIYFFVIRKRMDKNDDDSHRKNVEATDNGKDNLSPPPVFYSKPHKPPKDDSDGSRPVGMTNEGLDTSYDSKDLKGPPQYTNTVDDYEPPRYEKETHRGRANKAYEEEKEEKSEGRGRRNRHRDREENDEPKDRSKDREDRRSRHRGDREGEPRGRHYSTDDGTDNRYNFDPSYGDPNMGTSI